MNCAAPRPARNQKLIPLHSTQTGFVGFFLWSHGSSAVIRLTVALENVILLRERMGGGVIGVIGVRREEGRRRKEGGGTWLTAALCHPLTLLQRRRERPWKGSGREDSLVREDSLQLMSTNSITVTVNQYRCHDSHLCRIDSHTRAPRPPLCP